MPHDDRPMGRCMEAAHSVAGLGEPCRYLPRWCYRSAWGSSLAWATNLTRHISDAQIGRYAYLMFLCAERETSRMADLQQTAVFRWLAAGDGGDLEAFDDLLHPDVVVHAPAGLSTRSAEAEKQVWREALSAMPDLRHDVQEAVVDGDIEMARVIVTGTMNAEFGGVVGSGRSFRMDQAVIAHLRDGRLWRRGRWPTLRRCASRSTIGSNFTWGGPDRLRPTSTPSGSSAAAPACVRATDRRARRDRTTSRGPGGRPRSSARVPRCW